MQLYVCKGDCLLFAVYTNDFLVLLQSIQIPSGLMITYQSWSCLSPMLWYLSCYAVPYGRYRFHILINRNGILVNNVILFCNSRGSLEQVRLSSFTKLMIKILLQLLSLLSRVFVTARSEWNSTWKSVETVLATERCSIFAALTRRKFGKIGSAICVSKSWSPREKHLL